MLKEHIDELHRISLILIERETIDKDQFERLLAGETEEQVFDGRRPAPSRARAGRGEEAQAGAEAAAVPDPGSDHAAAAARRRKGLIPEPVRYAEHGSA